MRPAPIEMHGILRGRMIGPRATGMRRFRSPSFVVFRTYVVFVFRKCVFLFFWVGRARRVFVVLRIYYWRETRLEYSAIERELESSLERGRNTTHYYVTEYST